MKATVIQLFYIDPETGKSKFLFEAQIDGGIPNNNINVLIDYKDLPQCVQCGVRAVHHKYIHHKICQQCWGDNNE